MFLTVKIAEKGNKLERALMDKRRIGIPVTVNGKNFVSIADACREYGVNYYSVVNKTSGTDKTVEEAINDIIANPVKRKTGKSVTVNGKQFTSILDACKEYNVSYKAVANRRLGTNKTVEEAINDILANFTKCGPSKLITVNGKQFASIADVCKEYGVSYQTLYKRRAKTNKTVEDIVNEMLKLPQTEAVVESASQKSMEPEKRRYLVSLRGVYVIRSNRRNRQRKHRRILQAI